jgi:hypothetical protein
MPLIQSPKKKAFEQNVKTEMEANPGKKNRAQNLAIAYSVQRKNRKAMGGVVSFGPDRFPHSSGKYAKGGMAEMPEPVDQRAGSEAYLDGDERASRSEAAHDRLSMFKMADGGSVPPPPPPPEPTGADDFAASFKKATHYYGGGKILKDQMPDETDPRAGHEPSMDHDEAESTAERIRDKVMRMKSGGMMRRKMMAEGGFAEPEWAGAGTLGFPMMEQENDPDEYSKYGLINYADGGEVDDHYRRSGHMPPHKYADGGLASAYEEEDELHDPVSRGETKEERREIIEPTSQRLGEEDSLDDMEYPMSYHGAGQGEREAGRSFAQENPSIADSIRRKYMARGGRAMMASGGYANEEAVDKGLDQNAIEHTNYMYKLNRQLADNEQFSEMNALQDIDYNEGERDDGGMDSRDIPMDRYDMVDEIRRKYARNRSI